MIKLNDYLYSGDTVLTILHNYSDDLKKNAFNTDNPIDWAHSEFLRQITELLENNEFLTSQSARINELNALLAERYPEIAFSMRGRIKSLIRAESKFNGVVVQYTTQYYKRTGTFPTTNEIMANLNCFRDLIAYRVVISVPKRSIKMTEDRTSLEHKILYDIANFLPDFLMERGFSPDPYPDDWIQQHPSPSLNENVQPFFRDYVANPTITGYQSLHTRFYDNIAQCYLEVQLRTKEMDDYAEIGPANHFGYEQMQAKERSDQGQVPAEECLWFDEALERTQKLQNLDFSKVDVNMFTAYNNQLINDNCGLLIGRLVVPYEHLVYHEE